MTPHTVLESFIVAALSGARDDLAEQDRKRGGDGLRDMAITLTRGRTIIAVHSDFHDGDRTLSSSFRLSPPLPSSMRELVCEFLMDLHEWVEGRQAAPELPVPEPRVTLH
jgi:hypothetical protein